MQECVAVGVSTAKGDEIDGAFGPFEFHLIFKSVFWQAQFQLWEGVYD